MKQKIFWKYLIAVICILAAGIFYLRQTGEDSVQESIAPKEPGTEPAEQVITMPVTGQPSPTEQEAEIIRVHVCGAVATPGVYRLRQGDRVVDAIAAAGGFTADAAEDVCNQAVPVRDGERIYIPDKEEASGQLWQMMSPEGDDFSRTGDDSAQNLLSETTGKIDINTATAEQLSALQGIGTVKAQAIVAYRDVHGRFSKCEDLMKVPGIKDAVYQKICDEIVVIP